MHVKVGSYIKPKATDVMRRVLVADFDCTLYMVLYVMELASPARVKSTSIMILSDVVGLEGDVSIITGGGPADGATLDRRRSAGPPRRTSSASAASTSDLHASS